MYYSPNVQEWNPLFLEWKSHAQIVESTLKRVIHATTLEWIPLLFGSEINSKKEMIPNYHSKKYGFNRSA